MRNLKMRTAYNRSNLNLIENGERKKPGNFEKIVRKQWKNMPCLSCGKKFLSEGPYNRICAKCNLKNEKIWSIR
jgi:hypothetical protein